MKGEKSEEKEEKSEEEEEEESGIDFDSMINSLEIEALYQNHYKSIFDSKFSYI